MREPGGGGSCLLVPVNWHGLFQSKIGCENPKNFQKNTILVMGAGWTKGSGCLDTPEVQCPLAAAQQKASGCATACAGTGMCALRRWGRPRERWSWLILHRLLILIKHLLLLLLLWRCVLCVWSPANGDALGGLIGRSGGRITHMQRPICPRMFQSDRLPPMGHAEPKISQSPCPVRLSRHSELGWELFQYFGGGCVERFGACG